MLPRHADWKAAAGRLEKGWPLEYGDRRPLPSPREELQTPIGITMRCTLPSGNVAPAQVVAGGTEAGVFAPEHLTRAREVLMFYKNLMAP